MRAPKWTPAEDAIIRRHYADEGLACLDRLPGRTANALYTRARHIGVTKGVSGPAPKYDWEQAKNLYLSGLQQKEIADLLRIPRETLRKGIYQRGWTWEREAA